MPLSKRLLTLTPALAGLAALAGCSDHVQRSRYDMIREGMSDKHEVRMTLGEPTVEWNDEWQWHRHDRHAFVVINFNEDGRVVRKRWLGNRAQLDTRDAEPKPGEPAGESKTTITIDD